MASSSAMMTSEVASAQLVADGFGGRIPSLGPQAQPSSVAAGLTVESQADAAPSSRGPQVFHKAPQGLDVSRGCSHARFASKCP